MNKTSKLMLITALSTFAMSPALFANDKTSAHMEKGEKHMLDSKAQAEITEHVKSSEAFVKAAALDGMTEVEVGKLASSRASDAKVKEFAQKMVNDHTSANNELKTIAQSKGIQLPEKLDAKHQAMVDSLKGKSGAEFDAAYSKAMSKDHHQAVELFERASKANSIDADLQAFAKKTLPTLQDHHRNADNLPAVAKVGQTR